MTSLYPVLLIIHVTAVMLSLSLFLARIYWRACRDPRATGFWARRVPHINDTILFAAGISLAILLGQYPFTQAWLTVKLVGLVIHIILGAWALRRNALGAAIGSVAAFLYVVVVALTRDPTPW